MGNRIIRIGALVFVLLATASLIWPQATGLLSTKAVVNAPLLTIRAPINGSVRTSSPDLASPVSRNTQILELAASRESRVELQRLDARRTALEIHVAALRGEEDVLLALLEDMQQRRVNTQALHLNFLEAEMGYAIAARTAAGLELDRARDAQARVDQLADRGSTPQFMVREADLDTRAAATNVEMADAQLETLAIEQAAIGAGIVSPQGIRRGDYFIERMDEIYLRLADLRSRRNQTTGELAAVEQLHEALTIEREMLDRFRPTAAVDGLIWTASSEAGTDVNAGDEVVQVLDCQNRFLEASFPERAFERLSPGMIANIQLRGSAVRTEAVVVARHAVAGNSNAAIADDFTDNTSREGVTVYLKLQPADISDPAVASAFCDVGREAEVHIPYDRTGFGGLVTWVRASLGLAPDTEEQAQSEQVTSANAATTPLMIQRSVH